MSSCAQQMKTTARGQCQQPKTKTTEVEARMATYTCGLYSYGPSTAAAHSGKLWMVDGG